MSPIDLLRRLPLGGAFLGNHDVPGTILAPYGRVADQLGGNLTRLQSAALLLFSLPSTPFVYSGEEIGMRGARSPGGADPKRSCRNPMQWDATAGRGFTTEKPWVPFSEDGASVAVQDGKPGTLLETYRGLIKVRRSSPALARGGYREVAGGGDAVVAFLREAPEERVLVLVNFSDREATAQLDLAKLGLRKAKVGDRIFGTALSDLDGGNATAYRVTLRGYEGRWLLIH